MDVHVCYIVDFMFAISNGWIACPFLSWGSFFLFLLTFIDLLNRVFFFIFPLLPNQVRSYLPLSYPPTYLLTYPPPTNPYLNPHRCLHLIPFATICLMFLPLDSLCDSIIRVTMPTFVNLSQHNFLRCNVVIIACS
jgi:hypothetical protein